MIDLSQRTELYEVGLPYGLKVTARPLTRAGMAAAQAAANSGKRLTVHGSLVEDRPFR